MSIEIKNINKFYHQQKALDDVSFSIPSNQIVGFLGPNGAGKSTLMKIITGFLSPSSGEVRVCNIEVNENSIENRRLIGYLPEHNPLYLDMYVKEYLTFIAKIYKISNIPQRVNEIIELTGLSIEKNKKIEALSKGYRQRVGIAQAILPNPQVLILDEPTTGLDPNQIVEVRELIKTLGKEKTILLSTHIMQEVQAICDRVIIINKGKIVADDKASLLTSSTFSNEQIITIEINKEVPLSFFNDLKNIKSVDLIGTNCYQINSLNQEDIRTELFHLIVKNNLVLLSMSKETKSLEDVFHLLTNNSGS